MGDEVMSPATWPRYHYRGQVVRVVDGDTVSVMLDLGLNAYHLVSLRLAGVNAPEVVGTDRAAGLAATAFLRTMLDGATVYVRTYKDRRSFNRYVADIWVDAPGAPLEYLNVADELLRAGHAVHWEPGD